MRGFYASLFACAIVLLPSYAQAQQAPIFNGSAVTYDYGQCTNSTSTTCTGTTFNTYGANAQCFAMDTTTTNPVNAICSVSGSTVTVSTAPTSVGVSCAISGTTCTAAIPYTASSSFKITVSDTTSASFYGKGAVAGTTVTITSNATTTDTFNALVLITNPSATTHVFQYIVWQ